MADDDAKKGTEGAHTPGNSGAAGSDGGGSPGPEVDPDRAAKIGSGKAEVEAALTGLAAELAPDEAEADQLPLMLDEIDEQQSLFTGPVRHVADKISEARRGRGRPKGSKNKANAEFRDVAMRMGYRHPGLNLLGMANANPYALAAELAGYDPGEHDPRLYLHALVRAGKVLPGAMTGLVIKAQEMIGKANAELLPYFESKAPTKVDLPPDRPMGVMVIGEMHIERARDDAVFDMTRFDKPD
ncbi:hypothetical protein [Martelella sp. FOR1707]